MVPHTDDGRVMFAIPWHERVIVGTTDIPVPAATPEPKPSAEEIDFLLSTANRYLARAARPTDILSAFAGIRPLVSAHGGSTASLSREHALLIDPLSGLLTVAGGKWTTYRRMAEDAVDTAQTLGSLAARPCRTAVLAIADSDAADDDKPLHAALPLTATAVRRYCHAEMARRLEDVLARRSRCLLFDARAAIEVAPMVAPLMAAELGRNDEWIVGQIAEFTAFAAGYDVGRRALA
jgi:glycerol-3-phosphate dehydrogenase